MAFYWHFIRQTRGLYATMLITGLGVALVDSAIPVFIGQLVGLMTAVDRSGALQAQWSYLAVMVALVLIARPLMLMIDTMVRTCAVVPGVTALIRWQSHWHVIRQSWPFFQNDFAGRIANRVMNTGMSLRESVVSSIRAIWYISVFGLSALTLMLLSHPLLAVPTMAWIVA